MSKHTPGPWVIREKGFNRRVFVPDDLLEVRNGSAEGGLIAAMYKTNRDIDGKTDEANARLIAAAPDMLAACKQLVEACGNPTDLRLGSEQLQRFISAWGNMRAAIAKAEGAS